MKMRAFVACVCLLSFVSWSGTFAEQQTDSGSSPSNSSVTSAGANVTGFGTRVKYMSGFSNSTSEEVKAEASAQQENATKTMTPEEIDKEFKEKYKPLISQ